MTKVIIVVREPGRKKPDYSLHFDLPYLPQIGSYISIHRPDKPEPYSEDMIVKHVWWRLFHPETGGVVSADNVRVGRPIEIFVECDPALGPYSSDAWRDSMEHAKKHGEVEEFEIVRLSIRENFLNKSGDE